MASEIKTYYKRNLPHLQPIGGTFFVTFRLQGSLPKDALKALKEEFDAKVRSIQKEHPNDNALIYQERKRQFAHFDRLLDQFHIGPAHLKIPEIAQIVAEQIHRFDRELYHLLAYCIMPNHVHLLIDTGIQIPDDFEGTTWESLELKNLDHILFRIKGASARLANQALGRSGKFWQRESYDHWIRNERELDRVYDYILQNPVKAGLEKNWQDYPYSFSARSHHF